MKKTDRKYYVIIAICAFLSAVMWSLFNPVLHTVCIQSMPAEMAEKYQRIQILMQNGVMLLTCLFWDKFKIRKIVNWFPQLVLVRFIMLITINTWAAITLNIRLYYIIDIYSYSVIGIIMNRCCTSVKNLIFNGGEDREKYDSISKIGTCAAGVLICSISLIPNFITISVRASLILNALWIILDRGGWAICYILKQKENKREEENKND